MTIENAEGEQEAIDSTPEHPFYVEGLGWVEASSLHAGMTIWFANGTKGTVEDISNEGLEEPVIVYNFEVADFHTYFVGECGVLVHNNCDADNSLYRKMSEDEYKSTMETNQLQGQIPGSDSAKWLSQSSDKVQAFSNDLVPDGTTEMVVKFNMTDDYMDHLANTAVPQSGSKGLPNAKYHYEGLEEGGQYKNYGITKEELPLFNSNIVSIELIGQNSKGGT